MKNLFLILPLTALLFTTQGWAPPPGKGGSPSKVNIPKDQPGHSKLDSARSKGGQGMSIQMAEKYRKKYSSIPITKVTPEDRKIIKEARKVLKEDELKGRGCCNGLNCVAGSKICNVIRDGTYNRCTGWSPPC